MTSVRVIKTDGDDTYARATADEFESGVLTVQWLDPENAQYGPAKVYQPDQWRECDVLGVDGHPDFSFINNRAWQGHVASRTMRRSA